MRRRLFRRALLVLVPLCAYASAAWNGFVWDDHRSIERGRLIGSLRNIPALFRHDTMFNADGGKYQDRAVVDTYRPLTMTTYFVEHALFGTRAAGYHVDSVLIHVANVILLFLLARRLGLGEEAALWGALLFAVHPAIAEAVHWVNGRSDPLVVLFFLGSVIVWLDGRWLWAALLVFAAALCKETIFFLLPPLLLLRRDRCRLRDYLPLGVGAAAALALRLAVLPHLAAGDGPNLRYALPRLPLIWAEALRSLLLPTPNMPPSLYQQYRALDASSLLLAAAVLAVTGAAVVLAWRRGRSLPAVALAAVICTIAPVGMLLSDQGWPGWGRYLYPAAPLACIALASVLVDGVIARAGVLMKRVALGSGAALVAMLGLLTCLHGRDWHDDRSFATSIIRDHPGHALGYTELAVVETREQRPLRALEAAERAVALDPGWARHWSLAANALMTLGRREEAYRAAARALALDRRDACSRFILAIALLGQRREREAASLLIDLLVDDPDQAGAWRTLHEAAQRLGPGSAFVTTLRELSGKAANAPVASRLLSELPR